MDLYQADIAASLGAASAALEKAARLLQSAQRIVLVGSGASHGIAVVLSDVLFTLGKQVLPCLELSTTTFALAPPVEGLLVIAISHSGETQFPLRVVLGARKAGIPSIGLTNEPGSELGRVVDVVLPTQTVDRPEGSFAIAPRICQLVVLDSLLWTLRSLPASKKKSHK